MKTIPFLLSLRLAIVLFLFVFLSKEAFAQPNWQSGTPNVSLFPLHIDLTVDVDVNSNIHWVVFPYHLGTSYSGDVVKGWAGQTLPFGNIIDNGTLLFATPGTPQVITIEGLPITQTIVPNHDYSILVVAEDASSPGNYSVVGFFEVITPPCTPIQLFTFFGNSGKCVNLGANGVFQAAPLGVLPTGVLKGTTWTIDWGDGSPIWTYTSAFNDDIPPAQIHPFVSTTDCNYIGTWTIENPCLENLNSSAVFVVHGRDIPTDGDGFIEIVDNATGNTTIEICEGTEATVIVRDNSTWNCQNPTVPPPLTAQPNDDNRNLQWYYGENPTGGVTNTITGDVTISSLGTANAAGGVWDTRHAPSPMSPGETSETITIPATAVAGEYFRIYLKNWNKCNWPDPNYVDGFIDIVIIDAPDAPGVSPNEYCFGSVPATITASKNSGTNTLNWYADAALTTLLYTGDNFTHGQTAVGTYDYYVTETGGNNCEGPPGHLQLVINPIPNQPDISSGTTYICYDGGTANVTLTAVPNDPPSVISYQWYRNNVTIIGETGISITLNQVAESGNYRVRTYGINPTNCPSPMSDITVVSIGLPVTVEAGPAATICSDQTFNTVGSFGGGATSATWSTSGDGSFANSGDPTTIYTPGTNDIVTGSVTLTLTTNDPVTACPSESDFMVLTIDRAPEVFAGANASTCVTDNYQITDATASDYNTIAWSIQSGLGNLSNPGIINPTYNPNPGDAASTVTLRLTATANGVCTDVFDEMDILVDATPSASVGADQDICDVSTATLDGNSSGSDLNNNARGEWAYNNNLVFQETFTGSFDGAQDGLNWNLDLSNTIYPNSTTSVRILNNEMVGERISNNTGFAYFETEDIDISTSGNVKVTVDLRSAEPSGMEPQDFLNVFYVINGGAEIPFPVNGANNDHFGSRVAEASGLSGNTLKIVIRFRNSANNEFYYFDNIVVRQDDGVTVPTITDPSDPNSTVSGLLQGDNEFTWTVFSENGGCTPAIAVHTITRDLLPDAATAGPDQAFCETNITTLAGNVITDGGTGTWTLQSGTGSITAPNNPLSAVTGLGYGSNVFRWTAASQLGICADTWEDVTIDRNYDPLDLSGNVTITQNPVCYNTGAEFTITGSEADVNYYLYTGGAPVAGPVHGNGGNITITSPNMTAGATYTIRAVKDVTLCEIFFGNYPVTVNPQFNLAQLFDDRSICLNTSTDIQVILTGGTAPFDLEYSATPGGNTILNNYVSGTNINTGNLLVNTDYALVSVVDDEGCPAESLGTPITITVGAIYVSATITAGVDICEGDDAEIQLTSVGGAPPYTYEFTGAGAPVGEFTVYAADTTITLAGLAVGSHSYNLITARDVCGNNAASILNTPDALEVFEVPVITAVNNADPICNGDDTDIDLSSTVNGTIYSWTIIAGAGAPWVGGNAPSAGNFTEAGAGYNLAQTLQHSSTSPVTVTYQITSAGPGATACAGNTRTVSVVVAPTAVITSASSLILCTNTAFSYTITSSTLGATFLWSRAAVIGISNGALLNQNINPIAETLVNTTSGPIDVDYVITPSILGCTGTPFTFTVTVNPTPAINNLAAIICDDGSFAVTPADGGDGIVPAGTSYSWGLPVVTGGITGGVAAAGQASISGTLSNPTNTVQTATYTVTPLSGSCTGVTFTVTITVDPTPAINNLTETICDDGSFTTTPVNGADGIVPAGTTYSWAAPTVTGGITGGAAGAIQANIFGTLSNPTNAVQTATYTVTPVSGTCTGSAFTVVVTVNPTPAINDMSTTSCGGSGFTVTPVNGVNGIVPAGTTYSWGVPLVTGGLTGGAAAAGQANISGTLTNPTNTAQTATYTVTPLSGTCPGLNFDVTITVNPTPDINDLIATICDDGSFTLTPANGADGIVPAVTTYSWGAPTVTGGITGGVAAAGQASISGTLNNPTSSIQTATYTITPLAGTCAGATFTVIVTVNPTPTLSSSLTPADLCSNNLFSYVPTSGTAGTTFNWTRASIAGITPLGPTAGTGNPGETLRNITSATIPVTYEYTLAANGCSNIQNVVVNIKPEPVITPGQTAGACSGNLMTYRIVLDNFAYPNVTYRWPVPVLNPIAAGFSGGTARVSASNADITDTYINTTGALGDATYTVTPYYDGCEGTPVDVVIQIGSEPVLDPNLDDEACSQAAIGLTLQEAPGSIVPDRYDITAVNIELGLVSGGANNDTPQNDVLAGYLANNSYTNMTGSDLDVVYTVVPKFGPDCVGDPVDVTITIHPEPVILPGQTPAICSKVPIGHEILLLPANTPAGTTFDWPVPVMSDFSGQGTAGNNVAADPLGTVHLNDAIQNYSGANITATYTITPTSALSCVGVPTDVVVSIRPQPVTSPITGDIQVCAGETNLVYSVISNPGSTYTWTVPASVGTKTFDFSTNIILMNAAVVAGTGDITVVERNNVGCEGDLVSLTVDVSEPVPAENIAGDLIVCAQTTHTYSVTNRVGSVYSWSIPAGASIVGPASGSSITLTLGNNGGTVSVIETTAAGCITPHNSISVTVNPLPTATISNGGNVCQGDNQPLQVSFSGTGPWTFVYARNGVDAAPINTAANPYTLNVNQAGSYTITSVTDANTCTGTGSGTAVVGVYPTPTGEITGTTDICPGEGTVLTMSFIGTAPFTFTYTDGTTPVTVNNHPSVVYTTTVSPALTTTYTLTALSDGNGCTGTLSGAAVITLNVPAVISLTGTDPLCTGNFNGAVDLQILSGTPAYSYQWTGPNGYTANTEDIINLEDGTYNVIVTDGNGCETASNVILTDPVLLTVTAAVTSDYTGFDISCNGASDGAITSAPAGGTGAYSYEWFEDAALTISTGQTGPVANNLAAGTYYIEITDINLCTATASATLSDPTALSVTVNVTSNYSGENISCNGATDGQATALPLGGTGSYTYEWFEDIGLTVTTGITTQVANGLGVGDYWVRVLDENLCEIIGTVILTAPTPVTAVASVSSNYNGSDISCSGLSDGSVTVLPGGGTGTYTYEWFDDAGLLSPIGQTTQIASGLGAGTYWVEVTDVNGCTASSSATLNDPLPLTTTVLVSSTYGGADISCAGAFDGAITATPAGGTGAYSYIWYSNAAMTISIGQTTATAVNLGAGTYYVRVTDVNGCEVTGNATLTDPPSLTLTINTVSDFNGSDISCNGELDGEVTAVVGGGTGGYSYAWYDDAALTSPIGQTTATASGLGAGNYWVEVTDANGCTMSGSVTLTEPAAVTASAIVSSNYNGANISCFGAPDGELTAIPAGGTGAYSYAWYDDLALTSPIGQTTVVATGLVAGTYYVEITDVNLCSASAPVTLTNPPVLAVSAAVSTNYNGEDVSCNGATDGAILATPSGGTGTYTYEWFDDALLTSPIGQTTQTASNLGAGDYWVEVTDLNGCTASVGVTVSEPVALSVTVAVTSNYNGADISCVGAFDGSLTATPADGVGPYSYIWYSNAAMTISIGQTTATAVNLAAGTYYVRVIDANGCVTSGNGTLNNPAALTLNITTDSNFNGSDISCNGASDGVVTAVPGGGTGGYSYAWYNDAALTSPIGQTTATASGLGAGTYWVEVTDANGCTISGSVILTEPAVVTVTAAVSSNYFGSDITCVGASDGAVTASPLGGTGGYTYIWYADALLLIPIGQTTATAVGLAAGEYWVVASDANGCSATTSVTLTDPLPLTVTAAVISNYNGAEISCPGETDGAVEATTVGGSGTITYVWYDDPFFSSPIGQTTQAATNLGAGPYWVRVTDQNGCMASNTVLITEPKAVTVLVDVTSDYNGQDVSCNGASDGEATATASEGTGTYTYEWFSDAALSIPIGQTNYIATGLSAGTYYVEVTDQNGCTGSMDVDISEPVALSVTVAVTSTYNGAEISCVGANDGELTATPADGTGPYNYTWYSNAAMTISIGQTTATAINLMAGTYYVRVIDANGCVTSGSATLTNPPALTLTINTISDFNGSDISCNGELDGVVTAVVGGGTGAYNYAWYDDAALTSPIGQTTATASALGAGTYWVEATDANGCTISGSVILSEPDVVTVTAAVTSNYFGSHISCFGVADGEATATPTGGTGGYLYAWYADALLTTPIGQTTITATGLAAGTYWVEVEDANGCSEVASVTLNNPAPLSVTAAVNSNYNGADISCFGFANGAVLATPLGGTGTYIYEWYDDAGLSSAIGQTTPAATNLVAGPYWVEVTDQNGCAESAMVTLTDPPALTLSIAITSNYNGEHISCNGASDGTVLATVVGGTGTYSYIWYTDPAYSIPLGQFTAGAINLAAGDYYLRVNDLNGCEILGSIILTEPVALDATETARTDVSCFGGSDGSVTVTATAATGIPPYQYSINGGASWQATGTFSPLAAGNYIVQVMDDNGCTFPVPVTITQPTPLTASIISTTMVSCNGLSDGIISVAATVGSGTAPYRYSIDGGTNWQGTGDFVGLAAGPYTITVEDALFCSINIPSTITEPPVLELNPTADQLLDCFGDTDGSGSFYALGGTMPYTFTEVSNTAGASLAAPGFNSQSLFGAGAGIVTIRVTDAQLCEAEATITFTQPTQLTPGEVGVDQVICFGDDPNPITELTAAGGGPGGYNYQWQFANNIAGPYMNIPGETATIYDPPAGLASTTYYRRQVQAGICVPEYTDTIEVIVNPLPSGLLTGGETICPGESSILNVAITTGLAPFEVEIENHGIVLNYNTGEDISVSPVVTTSYRLLRITDSNGCEVLDPSGYLNGSATVNVRDLPLITADPVDVTTCEYSTVIFSATASGSELTYQWEVNDGSTWNAVTDGGTYSGSVTTSLRIFSALRGMNTYRYRMIASNCGTSDTTVVANLFVETSPAIISQPGDSTICEGDNATFEVTATGDNLVYTWYVNDGVTTTAIVNGGIYSGQGTSTLQLTGADRNEHQNRYYVRIEGSCTPPVQSNMVFLYVNNPPEISTEPVDNTLCEFVNAVFEVQATGEALVYQWQESTDNGSNWNDLSDGGLYVGTSTRRLTMFSVARSMDGNLYRVNISGLCGLPVQSAVVLLTVQTAPEILAQPQSISVCENTPAGFGVDAQGTGITYQWMVNDGGGLRNISVAEPEYSGANSDSLTLLSAQVAQNGYPYRVVVSGVCAPVESSGLVILLVEPNPVITTQPVGDAICENGNTLFTAGASGPAGMTYQWYVDRNDGNGFVPQTNDAIHLGSNTEQLSVSNAGVFMNGWQYQLEVSTSCTPVYTNAVTLTVWDNPVPGITPVTAHAFYPLICGGDLLTLDGSPVGGSGVYTTHLWTGSIGPLNSTTDQVVDFRSTIKGNYALAYAVTDNRGCVGSDVVTIENERPTAMFSSDAVPSCGYVDVNFTNNSSAEATSFLWDFADGTTSPLEDVTHGFDNTNPDGQVAYYNVFMEAISDHDCRDTARSVVTIYPKIVAVIDADPTEGCHPVNVTFLSTPGGANYNWDFGDGSAPLDGSYLAYHMYENFTTAAVVHTAQLITSSFYGCKDTATVDITVEPIPAPNFTAVPMVQTYPNATVTFTNTTQAGPWTFLWNFGDGNSSTDENPAHTYAAPGTYMVKFYVNNGICIDSVGTSIVIHATPAIADFEPPPSGCSPLEVQFVNRSQFATTYLWDFGDGYVSTKENPSHTFYDPGEMTVRLQATGPGGTAYASYKLNVYETPNVAFNSAPDSVFVKDKPVRFFNLTAGATNYRWDFGDYYEDGSAAPNNFSNAADTSHIYFTEGWKDVKLVAWNDQCIDSLTMTVVKVIPAGEIEFPTVFRPDPSGPSGGYVDPNDPNLDPNVANSIFFPGVNKQVEEYHLYIYNRWGELIFQSHDINKGWDGYIRDRLATQGVYLWKVTLVYKNGSPDSMAGDITLLWKRPQ